MSYFNPTPAERLWRAVTKNDPDGALDALKAGASPDTKVSGCPALVHAVKCHGETSIPMIGVLLSAGANVDGKDDRGCTALSYTLTPQSNHPVLLKLVDACADLYVPQGYTTRTPPSPSLSPDQFADKLFRRILIETDLFTHNKTARENEQMHSWLRVFDVIDRLSLETLNCQLDDGLTPLLYVAFFSNFSKAVDVIEKLLNRGVCTELSSEYIKTREVYPTSTSVEEVTKFNPLSVQAFAKFHASQLNDTLSQSLLKEALSTPKLRPRL